MTTRADAHKPDFHRDSAYPQPVRAATTANITIATALNNGDSLDGLTLATGDRVLVKDQSTGAENGIYIVGVTPVRADDMDTGLEAWGCIVKVQAGTVNANTLWTNTNTTLPTIGSSALTFVAAGGGAPTGADYLVGTAQGGLSAEIVVGTTPGGELGGTWASPTVDATHSGSTHDAATNTHIADTADAHDASAISVVPTGSLTATDVQAALAELDGDIAAGGIPATIFDAKGDLIAASAADTAARLAAAANGASLITASGESTGLKWRLNNDGASAAPTVNDDAGDGYSIGSRWLDTTNDKEYVCLDATTTAAVWVETSGGSGSAGALILLEQHTASSSATLDFTSTISSTYDDYLFELIGVKNATNTVSLLMRVSTDGGSSYDSGSNYIWSHMFLYPGASGNESGNPDTSIGLGGSVDNSHQGVSGTIKFYDPGSSVYKTLILDTVRWVASGINVPVHDVGAAQYTSNTAVNAVRFLFSSGNISSGTIRAYGIVK